MGEPSKQTTLYVIAYDISNNKRRTRVHKLLSGYGRWTQYSLFEAWLTAKELVAVQGKLDKLLNPREDSVRLYRLCAACSSEVLTIGSPPPKEETVFMV